MTALAFLGRHLPRVPWRNLKDVQTLYRSVRTERFAARLVRAEGISLIHSYFGRPRGFGGALARATASVPLVVGLRGSDVNVLPEFGYGSRLHPSFDRAFRRLLRVADRTVCVSEFIRREAVALGARASASTVVLKGVRLDVFHPEASADSARAALQIPTGPLLLAVSGLVPIKGLNVVLDALALVRQAGHDASLVVCGEGPERARLEAHAHRLRLAGRVRLCGKVPRPAMATYFAAADVFVHGALIEASGNAILEAMASGLPVVCTDAGGPAEYVENGESGFVVPVGDAAAIAEKVNLLLSDPDRQRAVGQKARARVESMFGYERMIAETIEVYRTVVREAGREPT